MKHRMLHGGQCYGLGEGREGRGGVLLLLYKVNDIVSYLYCRIAMIKNVSTRMSSYWGPRVDASL